MDYGWGKTVAEYQRGVQENFHGDRIVLYATWAVDTWLYAFVKIYMKTYHNE